MGASRGVFLAHKHILLIEDDWVLCHAMRKVLGLRGYRVTVPQSAEEIFSLLNQGLVSLVVSDLNLPWLNTLELCRLIKNTAHFKNIPFVFVSGSCDESKIKKAFFCGCDDFLNKPFHFQELITAVDTLLTIQASQEV